MGEEVKVEFWLNLGRRWPYLGNEALPGKELIPVASWGWKTPRRETTVC